jgi:uncharacterized membrane protein
MGEALKGLIVEHGGRIYVEDLVVSGKIFRKILEIHVYDVKVLTRFSWLKIDWSGRLFVNVGSIPL